MTALSILELAQARRRAALESLTRRDLTLGLFRHRNRPPRLTRQSVARLMRA